MPTHLLGYGCLSSAGPNAAAFWEGLREGRDHSRDVNTVNWPVPCVFRPQAYLCGEFGVEAGSRLEVLTRGLGAAWRECLLKSQLRVANLRLGVILASTKGCLEDFVWDPRASASVSDPLTPALHAFLRDSGLRDRVAPQNALCVSNACSSSLAALALGQKWLRRGRVDAVLVLGADLVGPFVLQGFYSLRALTEDKVRPFAGERSGLRVGEAATAILIGREPGGLKLQIEDIGLDSEGFSLTRPQDTGESLRRACSRVNGFSADAIDLVIAHGTATQVNDRVEDAVFFDLFRGRAVPITSTKWSVGHTLGASASMDLIAAFESLLRQRSFGIGNTPRKDPDFRGNYLTVSNPEAHLAELNRVLVTSLGFGGVHAAALVERTP